MDSKFNIQNYSHIRNGKVSLNGNILFKNESEDFSGFIKSAYKTLDINYPKFYKMDNLSKLAFIASDVLLKKTKDFEENIAIILSNKSSSLDTDRKHQKSISDSEKYYPSPAVFVYTLPNICIGEICIKHKLYTENSFYIFEKFNPQYLKIHAENLLKTKKAAKVLCGWVDFDDYNYDAFLYLVENNGDFNHSINNINKLYTCL